MRINVGHRRQYEQVKESLAISQYVTDRGVELRDGGSARKRGKCLVCGNGSNSDAFSADDAEGVWHCHACGEGGDVIDLCERAEGHDGPHFAMVALAMRYGVELGRPEGWYRKQSRQERTRQALRQEREKVWRRRVFKVALAPLIGAVTPEDEIQAEMKRAWEEFQRVPVSLPDDYE